MRKHTRSVTLMFFMEVMNMTNTMFGDTRDTLFCLSCKYEEKGIYIVGSIRKCPRCESKALKVTDYRGYEWTSGEYDWLEEEIAARRA